MRKITLLFTFLVSVCYTQAQTIADFENVSLGTDSFWDGRNNQQALGFSSGNAFFTNRWDTSFGGFWADGFACSRKKDTTDGTFMNKFSAITAGGYNNSQQFVVGQQRAIIRLTGTAAGKVVEGCYITNTTYAYTSMKNGDSFSKKFGGTTGNDSDFFLLHIIGWQNGVLKNDTVKFYLADYRSANNNEDYIVNNWRWVSLSSLGNVDSLQLFMTSSDVGQWGINTPLFYVMDNFTTRDVAAGLPPATAALAQVYPNPFTDALHMESTPEAQAVLTDVNGRSVLHASADSNGKMWLATSSLPAGIYFIRITTSTGSSLQKLIKH
jgi:hypothetical protein